jgi:hypothetical protein
MITNLCHYHDTHRLRKKFMAAYRFSKSTGA